MFCRYLAVLFLLSLLMLRLEGKDEPKESENSKELKKPERSSAERLFNFRNFNSTLQSRSRRQQGYATNDYGRQPPVYQGVLPPQPPPAPPQLQQIQQQQQTQVQSQPQYAQDPESYVTKLGVSNINNSNAQTPNHTIMPETKNSVQFAARTKTQFSRQPLQIQPPLGRLPSPNLAQRFNSGKPQRPAQIPSLNSRALTAANGRPGRLNALTNRRTNSHVLSNNVANVANPAPQTQQVPSSAPISKPSGDEAAHRYYYPPRMPLPLPTCFHNPTGYACCNPMLNDLMVETYTELESRPRFHTCNINAIATMLQMKAEARFNTSFETIAAFDDFAQKIHFHGDLVCKVELGGKYMLAYGTAKDAARKLPSPDSEQDPSQSSNNFNQNGRKKRETEFIGPKNQEILPLNHISKKYSMWI